MSTLFNTKGFDELDVELEGLPEDLISEYENCSIYPDVYSESIFMHNSLGLTINNNYPCDSRNYSSRSSRDIKYIVIHYTGSTGSAKANVKYYANNKVGASAHYFIGHESEDAQIYTSVNINDIAWHCGTSRGYYHDECRNSNSIGIEVCCHNDTSDKTATSGNWYFDYETIETTIKLVKYLMELYGIDSDHIVRHYDVTHKICPAPYVLNEDDWQIFKSKLIESEMTEEDEEVKTSEITVLMNGIETKLTTILHNDENYIRIRDLADAQKNDDLTVDWDADTKTVIINSK